MPRRRSSVADRTLVYEGGTAAEPGDHRVLGAGAVLGLLAVWEAVARLGWLPPLFLPAPSGVVAEAVRMTTSGELPRHVAASLLRIGLGFALGAAAGTAAGLVLGTSRVAE